MLPAQNDELHALSKVIFGQAHRLAVMVGIARSDGIINPGELAERLGFRAQSSIQGPLRDLEQAGLISRAAKTAGKAYYARNSSIAWKWVEELVAPFDLSDSDALRVR